MNQRGTQHDGRLHDGRRGAARGQARGQEHGREEGAGLLHDMPSVTNRGTGPWSEADTYGYEGLGGRGQFDHPGDFRGVGPARGDRAMQEDINERLTLDADIDAHDLSVIVRDGTATLSGTVPERRMKHCAEDLALSVGGVREVDNRIRVGIGAESFGPPGRAVRSGFDQQGSGFSSSEREEISERQIGATGAEGVEDVPRRS